MLPVAWTQIKTNDFSHRIYHGYIHINIYGGVMCNFRWDNLSLVNKFTVLYECQPIIQNM